MKIGLLGYGYWGRKVARAIARVGDLAMIGEPNHVRMAEALAEWGPWGTTVTSDPRDVLRNCEGVWIVSPADSHAHLVEQALEQGCHVLCEKPFVLDHLQAERLTAIAQAAKLTLMAGHLSLYAPEYVTLGVGITRITTRRWNTQASFSDHSVLWGLGPHDIALIVKLMGEPDEVRCKGTTHRVEATLLWNESPHPHATKMATVELDWLATHRWRFLCVGGTTVIDSLVTTGEHIETTPEPLLVEAAEFVRLMREPAGRMAKAEEAVAVTRTLHRLQDAMMLP